MFFVTNILVFSLIFPIFGIWMIFLFIVFELFKNKFILKVYINIRQFFMKLVKSYG